MYLGFQKRISPKLGFFGAVLAFGRGILSHYRSAGMASAPGAQPAHLSQPGRSKDMFAGWSGLLVLGISPDIRRLLKSLVNLLHKGYLDCLNTHQPLTVSLSEAIKRQGRRHKSGYQKTIYSSFDAGQQGAS